jgi:hypothetical protein
MRLGIRAVASILAGAVAVYALQDMVAAAQFGAFENPNPSLSSRLETFWSVLLFIIPGTLVALLANRCVPVLSAVAYVTGFLSHFLYHYGEWDQPPKPISTLHFALKDYFALLVVGAIGAIVAFVAAQMKRRLTHDRADTRSRARERSE